MSIGRRVRSVALFEQLGPGLITGAADDDPSGIATYSQAGAQFGYGLLWTMVFTYPLMCAVQLVSAHIGRVTGCGLAKWETSSGVLWSYYWSPSCLSPIRSISALILPQWGMQPN